MSTMTSETTGSSPALTILARRLQNRDVPLPRAMVSVERGCPEEGLALLTAYVSIEDPIVRQAILDVISILSQVDRTS